MWAGDFMLKFRFPDKAAVFYYKGLEHFLFNEDISGFPVISE